MLLLLRHVNPTVIAGAVSLDLTPTISVAGTRTRLGSVSLDLTPTISVSGEATVVGAVSLEIGLTFSVAGKRTRRGAVSLTLTPTIGISGVNLSRELLPATEGTLVLAVSPEGALTLTVATEE